eukprot:TRINITY_DN14226_c0_g2_i2.p1 TRINITY_DN14226_c0_g2~~TRINITY_DN14226_c0_g2_i2.p1  ORF type:complete len:478 (-),score=119.16 TRINITY_DN14226_c0_g2_i2:203-1636(-)
MSPAEPVIAERSVDMEALQAKIQGEIEAKLAQKEDSLWRRGQVEIKKLQQEQREVLQAVSTMQEQQAILVTENQLLRGHLAEVTGKFEEVVSKMRTVLRSLPAGQQQLLQQQLPSVIAEKVPGAEAVDVASEAQSQNRNRRTQGSPSPSPSEASTSASGEEKVVRLNSAEDGNSKHGHVDGSSWQAPIWHSNQISGDPTEKLFTPPRHASAANGVEVSCPSAWSSAAAVGPAMNPAVLSLASALPSAAKPVTPSPTGPLKRLHLAECLGDQPKCGAELVAMEAPPLPTRTTSENSAGPALLATSPSSAASKGSDGKAHPQQQYNFVTLELVKETGLRTLGIEVNQVENALCVDEIDEHGLVGFFNATQDAEQKPKESRIFAGDRIIEVNGIRLNPNRMLQECKVAQRLMITLRRSKDQQATAEGSPHSTKLRPEAQVFVPSPSATSSVLSSLALRPSAPPGLEEAPVLPEVKRTLFH